MTRSVADLCREHGLTVPELAERSTLEEGRVLAIVLASLCLTCCLVALPYIGTVILLPLHVFLRAVPLCFLGQLGPAYARFGELGPAATAASTASGP